jgi:5,10-methylenetetrahydromethanopterin reductase
VRFGAAFIPSMPIREIGHLARVVEDLGYDDLWIPDQSFHRDPFVVLASCAGATSSIRIGVAVTNPLTRHPVQIARAAATLAEASGGRFVLGLGAGNRTKVLPSLRLPTDRASVRVSEAIDICRQLFAGDEVSMDGQTLSLEGVRLESRPPLRIPIFVGTRGPTVLRLAGSKADGVFIEAMFTPAGLEYATSQVATGVREAGRDRNDVEIVAWQAIRLSTTVAAAEEMRYRTWAALLMRSTRPQVLEQLGVAPRTTQAVVHTFDTSGERAAASLVPDEVVAKLVLTGSPDEVALQLEAVQAHRVDTVSVIGFGNTEVVQDTFERFAIDVIDRSQR